MMSGRRILRITGMAILIAAITFASLSQTVRSAPQDKSLVAQPAACSITDADKIAIASQVVKSLPLLDLMPVALSVRALARPLRPVSQSQMSGDIPDTWTGKWIEVILSKQMLIAWNGQKAVRSMTVSTGTAQHPTVTGTFHIYLKLSKQMMSGPGYRLPNVPHVMYFYRDYAIHGTYWHNNFGRPMSHGCVNLRQSDAKWLFNWASPRLPADYRNIYATANNPGTLVVIRK